MAQDRTAVRAPAPDKNVGLLRQLGITTATALVVSNMIGTGIFTAIGFLAGPLGEPSLVLGIWIVGALCALAGAFCYSELGVNFPSSGGEYVYLTNAYGPSWGFMTGWVSFVAGFSAPIAATALAFSDYLGYFYPALKQENAAHAITIGTWTLKFGAAQMVACSLIAFLTLLNLFGVQRSARFQNVFTTLKVVVIVVFIVLGFVAGSGDWANFHRAAARTTSTPIVSQFAISLFWIYGSYSGWNAATYVAEELRKPEKTLPLALTVGTILVAALYFGLNAVFVYGAPLEEMKGQIAIGSLVAKRLFGPEIAGIFGGLMALALVSTVNAMVTIGPRVYYAMAKNRAFFVSAAKVDPRWHTPVNAIVAQGIASVLMTFVPFANLFLYISFTLNLFAGLSVASLFMFRKRPGWRRLGVVNFAYPLVPGFFLVVSAWMYYVGITVEPTVSLATVATVGIGALIYHFRIRQQN
ncbi:MAG TPA: amino acid permease [Bryobacteraceae bacterium]|nr:amino acid permease [Bryobacteraceae bacterium]